MSRLKIMAGTACFGLALNEGLLATSSLELLSVTAVFAAFSLGLAVTGWVLIKKSRSPISMTFRLLMATFFAIFIATFAVFEVHIRQDRKALQTRAKEFLLRPLPKLLVPDSEGNVGNFQVDPNSGPQNGVLGYSRQLIARFAINGRIRWSAKIQGEFASTSERVNFNFRSDAIETNEEVRLYLAERNAILGREWRMGFWQFIEDEIEFRTYHPNTLKKTRATNTSSRVRTLGQITLLTR